MVTDIQNRLKHIELLLLDVDGVLTDGSIIYDDHATEIKVFNAKDGLGIRMLLDAGITVGIVTGRSSKALRHRCRNLGVSYIFDDIADKAKMLETILKKTNKKAEQTAFTGDDLPDLKIMKRVGVSIAVANAHEVLRETADMITSASGGNGAVREICEAILKAKGLWEKTLKRY